MNPNCLTAALPEEVLKRRFAGDFEAEEKLIDRLLSLPETTPLLRERLLCEKAYIRELPDCYPYDRPTAMRMLREKIADFTEAELDALENELAVEYIYRNGEKYYLRSFLATLIKTRPEFVKRAGLPENTAYKFLDETVETLKRAGSLTYDIGLNVTLKIADSTFVKNGETKVWLPLPKPSAQQHDIRIEADGYKAAEDVPQRTVCLVRRSEENMPFSIDFRYLNTIVYADLWNGTEPAKPLYPNVPAPVAEDLAELPPHIVFTEELRALAEMLCADAKTAVEKARRIYEYVTMQVKYAFMRPYALIENQAEYCALNRRGDCGIQALLFITLCRIAGIPARWQSGLEMYTKSPGSHDWAQFYAEPWGWLFADPSYGGAAYRSGATERHQFYFGNLDPYRLVANSAYQADFDPPFTGNRIDPYDNQTGEAMIDGIALAEDDLDTVFRFTTFKRA
ncbi:MAG: transglutaminase-like domain-containing protein [Clostridia bacterium]|nr:transglutaminase-like domain-containing protein [Clostridia bacterium]